MYEPCNDDMMVSIPLSQWREIQKKLNPEQVNVDMDDLLERREILLGINDMLVKFPDDLNTPIIARQLLTLTYAQNIHLRRTLMKELLKIDEYRRDNVVAYEKDG